MTMFEMACLKLDNVHSALTSDGNEFQSIIARYRKVRFPLFVLGLGSLNLFDTENLVLYMWDELTGMKELYTY